MGARNDVAHAPLLIYNLMSLPFLAFKGHTYEGEKNEVTLKLTGGKAVHFPLMGNFCRKYGYFPKATGRVVDTACTVVAPGQAKASTTPSDIDTFHCSYGHTHEVLLLTKMAEQQGVNLSRNFMGIGDVQCQRGFQRSSLGRRTPE